MTEADPHELSPQAFIDEVHSFEHWFGSVESYLHGLRHGHAGGLTEAPMTADERDRLIGVLASYAVAETTALDVSSALIRIAPNHHCKVFLSTQVVDEGRHVEVVLQRLRELGVQDVDACVRERASSSIQVFRDRLLALVDAAEWDSALFAQNVVLESMEYAAFRGHIPLADPVTADLLERILRDERRHIGFGENELGRRLRDEPHRRQGLRDVKAELDELVLDTFEHTVAELGIPASERPALGRDYLQAVDRLGIA